jgi:hypothetical protein
MTSARKAATFLHRCGVQALASLGEGVEGVVIFVSATRASVRLFHGSFRLKSLHKLSVVYVILEVFCLVPDSLVCQLRRFVFAVLSCIHGYVCFGVILRGRTSFT